ncbi:MAG: hypothetical protein KGZ49_12325, partial [Syntrophaceae bacterium]|nr:hypothetical protein [Syntrophaceae bacterium]
PPPTSILPRKGGGGPWGCPICSSRGISVLFLVIAMMLMVSIGYVFSYLIPTKQKSVSLTVSSNQAFFLAQSGVEFAVRYAFDQGWATPADLAGLNAVGVNQRNLGKGRFTITYTNIAPTLDTLISVGEVPNASQRRIVVSNFTRFLMKIDYFASASNPADNGANTANPTAVTPPGSMQAGDLVLMMAQARSSAGILAISNTGGQSWTSETQQNQTNCRIRLFWCRFNGTWSANPSVSFGSANSNTVVMHVFRPSNTSSVWQVDVAQVSGNFAAPPAPNRTVTIPGITTVTDGALVFAAWASRDDNTWGSLTAGWSTPGSPPGPAQYRNTSGADQSQTHAYRGIPTAAGMPIAGATGNVSKNQLTLGGDPGARLIIAFRAVIM